MELTRQTNWDRAKRQEKRSMITAIMFGLLFVGWVGEASFAIDPALYNSLWRSPLVIFARLFAPVPFISLTPWQLLLIALAPFCVGTTTSGAPRQHARDLDRAIFVSLTCIVVTFAWGLARGGAPYFAYYQVWRFLTALLVAYMLMSALRTPRDLVALGKIVVLAALIRATLCIYCYWTVVNGKVFPLPEYITNHDDSMLFVAAILIVVVPAIFKGQKSTWFMAVLILPYIFYAMVLNDRRIAWVELGLALPLAYVLIGPGPLRSKINRWAIAAAPLAVIYIAVGWGSSNPIFEPVRALSSTGSDYDPSSLTRQEEARNLLHTLVDSGNPILGTGWGVPYDKVESYWSNYAADWILVQYTPHNSLLGLAAFAGLFGIIGIWGVVPLGAYLGARGFRNSTELVPRTAAMVAISSIAAYSVHCYGDVGLQSLPGSLIFGAALATVGKVAAWSEAATRPVSTAEGSHPVQRSRLPYRKAGANGGSLATRSQWSPPSQGNDGDAKPNRVPTRRLSR